MSRLFLVRHAQASFLQENYDELSALGETQGRLLGEYWARRTVVFDRACTGPCVRQKDTARFMSDEYRKAGLNFPAPLVLPEFDEYQGEAVLARGLPRLLEINARVRELQREFQSSARSGAQRSSFQKLFEAVITEWVRGAIPLPGVETWSEFCSRVNLGLSKILANGGRGERVAIVTSGGPLAVFISAERNCPSAARRSVAWSSQLTT